jgi:hypothetical protein
MPSASFRSCIVSHAFSAVWLITVGLRAVLSVPGQGLRLTLCVDLNDGVLFCNAEVAEAHAQLASSPSR